MTVSTNCEGFRRRDCLKLGLGALFGGSFVDALRMQAHASDAVANGRKKATNCILIWMDGGPTHFETFDPKPEAPAEIRGEFDPIATSVPGVHFSEHMTKLASNLHRFSMIRSIRHNQGNHGAGNHYMMTGAPPRIPVGCGAFVSFHPSMGSVVSHELGQPTGLPQYFSMPRMARSGGPNFLGAKYAPFVVADDPNKEKFRVRDVALPNGLETGRFSGRTDIRAQVDKMRRIADKAAGDPIGGYDEYFSQGYDLVTSQEAQEAFDISRETDETREAYVRNGFGQRCLLARRLVEAGVPFVTVYDGGWDHHGSIFPACRKRLPEWDQTVSALIEDLDQRGMLETTIVVALGEFGRTPKISQLAGRTAPGRDHWANAMSVLMAGGGTPGNTVVGATDRKGYTAIDRVLSPENFVSTVYSKLGINPDKMLYTPQGRPTHLVSDPTPISEVMA
ncbi:hypothetical protein Pan258_21470 [Symmachiella dynata]|uniref:DUF1501 domain-containing protein n=1 Tax=Symmachiella dynata TaxID=2527995 RepID=UPI00118CD717|nr:DUF1501 domain-containing protein [Symmachiella dynata]QDT48107.1 hypothetical protein Pan258_21470 [Symmachiella dynata]